MKLVFEANRLRALRKCEDLPDHRCLDEIVAFLNREHRTQLKNDKLTKENQDNKSQIIILTDQIIAQDIKKVSQRRDQRNIWT